MVKVWPNVILLLGLWTVAQALFSTLAEAQLSPDFYSKSCPKLLPIVGKHVKAAIHKEARMAASLLRLHFHDCFVQGCDGSILLDGPPTEKTSRPNNGSVRGYEVIDTIKAAVESACPNVVSCADIVALASFFSVVLSGGPIWSVPLGRRDSLAPNLAESNSNLPSPFNDIGDLKGKFDNQSLGSKELVALSGGHTIGIARCVVIKPSLYTFSPNVTTDPSIKPPFLRYLEKRCPNVTGAASDNVQNHLDIKTYTVFDNLYFKQLLVGKGILHSDRAIITQASDTEALVKLYARDQEKFFEDFASSMIKMGNLNTLTGKQGQIRKNCRVPNPGKSIIGEQERSPVTTHQNKGAVDYFKQAMKDVLKELAGDEVETLVENSFSGVLSM